MERANKFALGEGFGPLVAIAKDHAVENGVVYGLRQSSFTAPPRRSIVSIFPIAPFGES
jgi:hypothetical protein